MPLIWLPAMVTGFFFLQRLGNAHVHQRELQLCGRGKLNPALVGLGPPGGVALLDQLPDLFPGEKVYLVSVVEKAVLHQRRSIAPVGSADSVDHLHGESLGHFAIGNRLAGGPAEQLDEEALADRELLFHEQTKLVSVVALALRPLSGFQRSLDHGDQLLLVFFPRLLSQLRLAYAAVAVP